MKEQHPVRPARRERCIVQARDDEAARVGAGAEEGENLVAVTRIEMVGRLVEQADGGVLRKECRDVEPASFAAGQGIDGAVVEVRKSDGAERRVRAGDIAGILPLPEGQVRVASDERGFEDCGRETVPR